jgi:hypothetical protein
LIQIKIVRVGRIGKRGATMSAGFDLNQFFSEGGSLQSEHAGALAGWRSRDKEMT